MPTQLVRFALRRDTAANWSAANPTLHAGEPALETDTDKWKTGDGATAWNSLPYMPGSRTDAELAEFIRDAIGLALVEGANVDITVNDGGDTITIAVSGLTIGSDVQAYDADLAALAANSTNGVWTRTGAGTGAARIITGTTNEIIVTNGDGVSGNPTLGLASTVVMSTLGVGGSPSDVFGVFEGGGELNFGSPTANYMGLTFSNAAVSLSNYNLAGNGADLLVSRVSGGTIRFREGNSADQMTILTGGNVGIGEASPDYKLDVNGSFGFTPGASVTPADNGDVVFELTNNTTLTIKAKGSDGTVRTATVTLA